MQLRKLRVGVWIPENYKPTDGGGFSLLQRLIDQLGTYKFKDAEIVFISFSFDKEFTPANRYTIKSKLDFNIFDRTFKKFGRDPFGRVQSKQQSQKNELASVIDIIYYPVPTFSINAEVGNFPYICTLWDLSHIASYNFPELSMNGVFEFRQPHLEKTVSKALFVLTESEAGKKEVEKYLLLDPKKIRVVSLFPSDIVEKSCIAVKHDKINPDEQFVHYPAQFWAHKNHYNLILAFAEVLKFYPNLKLVLTGADKGNKAYIFDLIESLKLKNNVIALGFIAKEELKWIYQNSCGLVMPTFLGPTNMPVLEAAMLGCPVACSDFEGHKEQLGDYAYYFNPASRLLIADAIKTMVEDKLAGKKRIFSENNFTIENTMKQLDEVLSEVMSVRFCWGAFDEIF